MTTVVELENVFQHANGRCLLNGVSFAIQKGESFALLGQNGAGKTMLLRLIMALDRPSAGRIVVLGQDYGKLSGAELSRFRRSLGMVLQGGALLNGLTVVENLLLPLRAGGYPADSMWRKARLILTQLRLDGLENLYPRELSGGVLRKVELARALIQKPEVLMWDELLDGLDPAAVIEIEEHLAQEKRTREMTILFTTHQASGVLPITNRVGVLDNGTLLFDGAREDLSGFVALDPDLKYALKGWL
ncbi:MAG: ATP-binding cassette domain-containing protein [Methylococcaceae bacterium]|nr:ATP-binding cassette domain-containing protein [Methylococcaceae bacterium]